MPVIAAVLLGGCVLTPRLPPPPDLVNTAAPIGFSPRIRMLADDRAQLMRRLPEIEVGLRAAAGNGPVNMLVLSGGGAYGAFGAGALIGMAKANKLPPFEVVTGVSAGALLAPFAFLGPSWDADLHKVFESRVIQRLQPSIPGGLIKSLLFPQGIGGHSSLRKLVDRTFTDSLIAAVARVSATGRMLIIATTNLDDQETVLWDMGAIARHGGKAADKLFREVLTASASVPGVFPPVMIRVREGDKTYDEMHVDGSITTPLFFAPIIAVTMPGAWSKLARANIYVIVNGHLVIQPAKVPIDTLTILRDSFSAETAYKTKGTLGEIAGLARFYHMHLRMTSLPAGYSSGSFLDFHREHLRQLFRYGEACAEQGELWTSITAAVKRNLSPYLDETQARSACPAVVLARDALR